jgi:tetratricopeptide (TPR) repeat protein
MSPMWSSRWPALVVAVAIAACGGGNKKTGTTPKSPGGDSSGGQSMTDTGDPSDPGGGSGTPGGAGGDASGSGAGGGGNPSDPGGGPAISVPNLDPDPAQAKSQVEQHLTVARSALNAKTPDAETALREARLALAVDAANVDAAAMVAFAYYHKRLYDTAELVLDDLYRREAAKGNANVNYVYGLVYDKTNRPDQAVLAYKKCVQANPNHASALVNLGVHQLKNSQYGEAQQTFERLTQHFHRNDAVTLTSLGSAYRGRSAEYPANAPEHDQLVRSAESSYKRAIQANNSYGPAYYNLGLLHLDNDPYPGMADPMLRLTTAKGYFDQYKNMPGFDLKLYETRMKDVEKAIKRVQKQMKKKASGG